MIELEERRTQTKIKVADLKNRLTRAERIAGDKACVYATGSFGRGEASKHSDLDIFILGKDDPKLDKEGRRGSQLKRLDDICIKAELIHATREMDFPEFSGDGKFLVHYSVRDFTKELGSQEDDFKNTFTARLLLLLESIPLVGAVAYNEIVSNVLDAYWRDWEGHSAEFMPAFLANDILRLWRTFCVNYEARTLRMPAEEKAKGKLRNYKLKHSRMLTCYSALLSLSATFSQKGTVSKDDALLMIGRTPTQRLEALMQDRDLVEAHEALNNLLINYNLFLKRTDDTEENLLKIFGDPGSSKSYFDEAYRFGDIMAEAMSLIGSNARFHRLLIV
ncbi:nucleotidyltransferase domain-containing protein [Beijerinckia sp. L45]|uniref:nucleotidyltransferase domain-containing protein n=1 Tax=Beijerinckia sp. L45 TaxID=1641855 RepID=UPI00131BAB7F|nr:nucleotidyltransferase domain-containing protein [Beijerinckia sp. L45]